MSGLVGRTIRDVRPMSPAELQAEGWDPPAWQHPVLLVLDDGTKLYASRDAEGNGPGTLFGTEQSGRSFRITPVQPP